MIRALRSYRDFEIMVMVRDRDDGQWRGAVLERVPEGASGRGDERSWILQQTLDAIDGLVEAEEDPDAIHPGHRFSSATNFSQWDAVAVDHGTGQVTIERVKD